VFNAIVLIANAIVRMQKMHCGPDAKNLCANFWTKFRGAVFYDWIVNSSFVDEQLQQNIQLQNGSAEPVYDILQYKHDSDPAQVE
jgi:hypothetical protein